MAKKKADDDDGFYSELAGATGGEVLDLVDTASYFIDTGSLALNFICSGRFIGGGIPGGRLTEIYGPSASSKSLIGTNILYGTQKMNGIAILLDTENACNKQFIQSASHCNLARIVRATPQTLEQAFTKIYKMVEFARKKKGPNVPIVIVLDSISVLPCEREFREVGLPEGFSVTDFKKIVGGKEQPGEKAKIISKELRKLNAVMEETGVTVVIMNQVRSKVGVVYGNPETPAQGGNSLPFYASCRLRPQMTKKIEKKYGSRKKILGVNVKIKNVKNRSCRPFIESDGIQLFFEKGVNPISGLLTLLIEDERLEGKSGNFTVKEPWAGGLDLKFKASLDRNVVPMDVLLKCPALIDAKNEKEVEDYLAPFLTAVNYLETLGSDLVEDEVDDEDRDADEIDEALG